MKMTEEKFLRKVLGRKNEKNFKLVVINKSLKNKIKVKLGLVRYVLYSYERDKNFLKIKIKDNYQTDTLKFNIYVPNFSIGYIGSYSHTDIANIYRRNKILDFIRSKSLEISIKMEEKRNIQTDKVLWKWANE